MTPNYFNKADQNFPSVTDFQGMNQGMNEQKQKLRSHLRSMKRVLSLKRVKQIENQRENQPKPVVDHNELNVEAGPIRKASIDVQGETVLRSAKSLLGLTIVSHSDSSTLGEVRDFIFDHETKEVLAFVLENHNSEVGQTPIIPWSEICCVDKERIIVYRPASKMNLSDYPRALHAFTRNNLFSLNSEEEHLSLLADMCIDEASGIIVEKENREGFNADDFITSRLENNALR